MPMYLQITYQTTALRNINLTSLIFVKHFVSRVGLSNFIVVALKHKEYDLLALYDKLCLVAYFEHTFNNFCIPADKRQIN